MVTSSRMMEWERLAMREILSRCAERLVRPGLRRSEAEDLVAAVYDVRNRARKLGIRLDDA